MEVLILIEVVDGGVVATPYAIPMDETARQKAVEAVEAKFAAIVREVADREISDAEMYDLTGDGRYDYNDNCSVQLHWSNVNDTV